MSDRLEVVSAVILREGRLLLTQRDPSRSDYGWAWESPGGKVEGSETPEEALAREVREELGVDVAVRERLAHFEFEATELASGRAARITFYRAELTVSMPEPLQAVGLGWFLPEELAGLRMAPANVRFRAGLMNLARGGAA